MNHKYHEDAERELNEAAEWYEHQQDGLAAEFVIEIDHAVGRILGGPETFSFYEGEIRCCPVRRFPYVVLYRPRLMTVEIIAIMHHSRRPGYWRRRLREPEK